MPGLPGGRAEPRAKEVGELVPVGSDRSCDVAELLCEPESPHRAVRRPHVRLSHREVGAVGSRRELQDRVALVPGHLAREGAGWTGGLVSLAIPGEAIVDELPRHGDEGGRGSLAEREARDEPVVLDPEPATLWAFRPRADRVLLPVAEPDGPVGMERVGEPIDSLDVDEKLRRPGDEGVATLRQVRERQAGRKRVRLDERLEDDHLEALRHGRRLELLEPRPCGVEGDDLVRLQVGLPLHEARTSPRGGTEGIPAGTSPPRSGGSPAASAAPCRRG